MIRFIEFVWTNEGVPQMWLGRLRLWLNNLETSLNTDTIGVAVFVV